MKTLINRLTKTILFITICINTTLYAASNNISDITNAYLARDIASLNVIKKQLATASYEMAYANYRLALFSMFNDDKSKAEILLDDAEATLKSDKIENSSLNYSLLASVYSLKAGLSILSGAINGKKSSDAINKAQELNDKNPQVWLVKGLSAYHTPGIFGGSNKKAIQFFNKAISLYSKNQDKSVYWGLEEALVWRAILHKKNKQTNEAIRDLKEALSYNENFVRAKELLVKFSV